MLYLCISASTSVHLYLGLFVFEGVVGGTYRFG